MSSKRNFVAGAVFLLLLAVYVTLKLGVLEPKVADKPTDYELTEAIFTAEKDAFSLISVTNPSGSFSFEKQEDIWVYQQRPETELEQSYINSLSWDYVTLKPTRTIEEQASDLEQYGLEQPQAKIQLTLKDNTEATFLLGNAVEGQNGYYFMKQGETIVYLIGTVEGDNILHPLKYYRKTTLFSAAEESLTLIAYQNQGKYYEIKRDSDGKWQMVQPYERGVYENSLSEVLITPALEVKIEEFYDQLSPKDCGLDQPEFSLQLSSEQGEDALLIGPENDSGLCYAKWESKDDVFGISKEAIAFLEADPLTYLERYVYLPNIDTIEGFSGTIQGKEFSMEILRNDEKETYVLNGKEVESRTWKEKFQVLLNAEIIGMVEEEIQTKNPVISYTAQKIDGTMVAVSFFPMGERNFAVSVNGQVDFYVSKNTVDAIIENF